MLATIEFLLTVQAEGGPRHGLHPLEADLLFALYAITISPAFNATQSRIQALQYRGVPVKSADREFALDRKLGLVELIRNLLDRNLLSLR